MQNSELKTYIPKPPKKRFQPRDLRNNRAKAYNATHSGINILNNHMLDRYLKNREELIQLGVRVDA